MSLFTKFGSFSSPQFGLHQLTNIATGADGERGPTGPTGPAGGEGGFDDGSVSAPSIYFASDTDTGLYRVGANSLGIAVGGVNRLTVEGDGTTTNKSLCSTFQMTTGGATGYYMTAQDGDGNAQWSAPPLTADSTTTAVGSSALGSQNLLFAEKNTAIGVNAGASITVGTNNTLVGHDAFSAGLGHRNTVIGTEALSSATSSTNDNVAIGDGAMKLATTASFNVAIGKSSLEDMTGDEAVAVGFFALNNNTADHNVGIGAYALSTNVTGVENTAVGWSALRNNTASNNTAFGYESLTTNTTGTSNTAFGRDALRANLGGSNNTCHGESALASNVSGAKNTGIGKSALSSLSTGSDNTAIGYQALKDTNGGRNVGIGSDAGVTSTGSGNVFIGTSCLPDASATSLSGSVALGDNCRPDASSQFAVALNYATKMKTNFNVISGRADGSANHIVMNISGTDYKVNVGDQGLPESVSFGRKVIGGDIILADANEGSLAHGYTNDGDILATGWGSSAFGYVNLNGKNITASGLGSFAHGRNLNGYMTASGDGAEAGGMVSAGTMTTAGDGSVIKGYAGTNTDLAINGHGSQIMGYFGTSCDTTINGSGSQVLGYYHSTSTPTVSGNGSTMHGYSFGAIAPSITGNGSMLVNYSATASAPSTIASNGSLAVGNNVILQSANHYSLMVGAFGTSLITTGNPLSVDTNQIQIAGGSDSSNRDICMVLGADTLGSASTGKGYADAWETTGADYAEFFEWSDGNTGAEDRIAYFVKLSGEGKIEKATVGNNILGVVTSTESHTAFIADGHAMKWQGAKLRDEFGRALTELTYKQPALDVLYKHYSEGATGSVPQELVDAINAKEDTDASIVDLLDVELRDSVKPIKRNQINPAYDPDAEYIRRNDRPEWDPVSLLGKVYVRDDGSCIVGQKCSCNSDGVATLGTDWFVMERKSSNVVRIFFR